MSRILITDDDPIILLVISKALTLEGHDAATSATVDDALPMLPYVDACIVDGMRGDCWRVLDRCKVLSVPVVLYTGDADLEDEARLEGFAVVRKPAMVTDLLAELTKPVGVAG